MLDFQQNKFEAGLSVANGVNVMEAQSQIIDLRSIHFSNRNRNPIKYIVVHSTATPPGGTVKGTANYLRQNDRQVSVHEFVSADTIYRMVPDESAAHHCGSFSAQLPGGEPNSLNNQLTWGIEAYQIAGAPVAPEVVEILLERVVAACRRLGIPSTRVVSHAEIDPTRRTDPVGVDINAFRAEVSAALDESEPSERSMTTWTPRDAAVVVWFNEQLARSLRGDVGAIESLIGALQMEPKRAELHNIIVEKALPPLRQERDKMPV